MMDSVDDLVVFSHAIGSNGVWTGLWVIHRRISKGDDGRFELLQLEDGETEGGFGHMYDAADAARSAGIARARELAGPQQLPH